MYGSPPSALPPSPTREKQRNSIIDWPVLLLSGIKFEKNIVPKKINQNALIEKAWEDAVQGLGNRKPNDVN